MSIDKCQHKRVQCTYINDNTPHVFDLLRMQKVLELFLVQGAVTVLIRFLPATLVTTNHVFIVVTIVFAIFDDVFIV